MASTLLDLCTRALDEISGFNVPTFIIGNDDDTAKQLLAFAKKVGTELVRDYDWQEMIKDASVTTVVGVDAYDVEDDYERVVQDTTWDTSNQRPIIGNTTARLWNLITTLTVPSSFYMYYRIIGTRVKIRPVPTSVFTFTYEYRSKNYCQNAGGDDLSVWTSDTDVPLLPEDLFINGIKYYMLKENSLPYGDAEAEYDAVIESRQSKNTPSGAVDMSAGVRTPDERYLPYLNIPTDRVDS
jgi:hypothetical protein